MWKIKHNSSIAHHYDDRYRCLPWIAVCNHSSVYPDDVNPASEHDAKCKLCVARLQGQERLNSLRKAW